MSSRKVAGPLLTTSDVARLLNVHINTVRRWSNIGEIKVYRIGSRGDRRFRRQDITRFLDRQPRPAHGNGSGEPLGGEHAGSPAALRES